MNKKFLTIFIFMLGFSACGKVPLKEYYGDFSLLEAYWFEREHVGYVFFRINENWDLITNNEIYLRYNEQTAGGGEVTHVFDPIDFTQAVHEHYLVRCGDHQLCGSYSFYSKESINDVVVGMRYDKNSSMALERHAGVHNILNWGATGSHSAIVYGVFNEHNDRVQVTVKHNFNSPTDEEVPTYGMVRKFEVTHYGLLNVLQEQFSQNQKLINSFYQFPAGYCSGFRAEKESRLKFSGQHLWINKEFDRNHSDSGACFHVNFMSKDDKFLSHGSAYARKNPVLSEPPIKVTSPLKPAHQIPITIAYCQDEQKANLLTDKEFFKYQKFILNMEQRDVDICYRIGSEQNFKENFETLLAQRLTENRTNNPEKSDFVFVIAFHQLLSDEFRIFHQVIAESLTKVLTDEAKLISPRAVGALVYDTSGDFRPTALQSRFLNWCPIELPKELQSPQMLPQQNFNCTNLKEVELDLKIINFLVPIGPFPTRETYNHYVDKYGDRGLARHPQLIFYSVPHDGSTRYEDDQPVTIFKDQRIYLDSEEAMRFCKDRPNSTILTDLRFRPVGLDEALPSLNFMQVEQIWLSEQAIGEYQLGIHWEFPYWGGVRYSQKLTGKAIGAIPFERSFKQFELLGDDKWLAESWELGKLMQKCSKYCNHPYFDAQGVYQIQTDWRKASINSICPSPKYPEWPGNQ